MKYEGFLESPYSCWDFQESLVCKRLFFASRSSRLKPAIRTPQPFSINGQTNPIFQDISNLMMISQKTEETLQVVVAFFICFQVLYCKLALEGAVTEMGKSDRIRKRVPGTIKIGTSRRKIFPIYSSSKG